MLSGPQGVIVDTVGNLIIADTGNGRIRKVDTSGIITTIAGTGGCDFGGDNGLAVNAKFCGPIGLAIDSSGNLFFSDSDNFRIRKIYLDGIIATVVGSGIGGFSGDNGLATNAQLNEPVGIAFDSQGNLYIGDSKNLRIRKISPSP